MEKENKIKSQKNNLKNKKNLQIKEKKHSNNQQELFDGVKAVSLGLFFEKEKRLVLGDMHLGQEEELNNQGILIPRKNFEKVLNELEWIFEKIGKVREVILLGDVKHAFGKASNQEWREVIKLIEILEKNSEKVFVIRGNHDSFIKSISNWKRFEVVDKLEMGDFLFCHGNKIIKSKKKKVVIGHEHAAIVLRDEHKKEKFKCFGKIEFDEKEIVIMPSFNFLTKGTDLIREKTISPYLSGFKEAEFWIVEERKIFYFGKIKKF
jgi:uncharacterized protein